MSPGYGVQDRSGKRQAGIALQYVTVRSLAHRLQDLRWIGNTGYHKNLGGWKTSSDLCDQRDAVSVGQDKVDESQLRIWLTASHEPAQICSRPHHAEAKPGVDTNHSLGYDVLEEPIVFDEKDVAFRNISRLRHRLDYRAPH